MKTYKARGGNCHGQVLSNKPGRVGSRIIVRWVVTREEVYEWTKNYHMKPYLQFVDESAHRSQPKLFKRKAGK